MKDKSSCCFFLVFFALVYLGAFSGMVVGVKALVAIRSALGS